MALTKSEREAFLSEPHVAALSVEAEPGRAPLTVPVWYQYEPGGRPWLLTGTEGVGKATFEALSGNPVSTTVFDDVDEVAHVRLGQGADLVVIAPATADLMARAAQGRADDLLTASLLTVRCPVLFVPAMHTEM